MAVIILKSGMSLEERIKTLKGADPKTDVVEVEKQFFVTSAKAADPNSGIDLEIVITTGDLDRDNEIVDPDGLQIENFLKNPVFLWSHNAFDLPIGRVEYLKREGKKWIAGVKFVPAERNPQAGAVLWYYQNKYLNDASIRFRPIEWVTGSMEREGYFIKFLKAELVESSAVSIGANPSAGIGKTVSIHPPDPASIGRFFKELSSSLAEGELDRFLLGASSIKAGDLNGKVLFLRLGAGAKDWSVDMVVEMARQIEEATGAKAIFLPDEVSGIEIIEKKTADLTGEGRSTPPPAPDIPPAAPAPGSGNPAPAVPDSAKGGGRIVIRAEGTPGAEPGAKRKTAAVRIKARKSGPMDSALREIAKITKDEVRREINYKLGIVEE